MTTEGSDQTFGPSYKRMTTEGEYAFSWLDQTAWLEL
jgi:hypothetical protein